ncbi:MAG: response regulator transcription factor [Acidobacteriota bacterium]|jgi:DNA-binding response OmpR family regulator|nr:response regulator transcription factor [Acidobacteriota bacterium]
METILVIEDDPAMLRGLKDNFAFKGYRVLTAADGEAGLAAAVGSKPDLILLDIMLPKINGYEICRLVRAEGLDVPIIMLTAKGQESDIVLGLNLGADDYVTKPFNIQELLARINAFLRRRRKMESHEFRFGDFTLNLDSRQLLRKDREITLTPKEFGLLAMLVQRAGCALTRNEILRRVWGYDILVTARSVDRCVNTLRNKIESNPNAPVFIKTIRDVGYRFEPTNER